MPLHCSEIQEMFGRVRVQAVFSSFTAQHQCTHVRDHLFCFSPRQHRYLGHTAPLTASAVGERSLMWVYHITGTPGCSTLLCSVPLHCTQARYILRTAEVTICIISERLLERSRQLPLHSLTAEAEGGYQCCSRTSGMPSFPSQTTPGQRGRIVCQPCPRQHTWLQRASRQLQGQGGREKKRH